MRAEQIVPQLFVFLIFPVLREDKQLPAGIGEERYNAEYRE
jgi:hypothetical protein